MRVASTHNITFRHWANKGTIGTPFFKTVQNNHVIRFYKEVLQCPRQFQDGLCRTERGHDLALPPRESYLLVLMEERHGSLDRLSF